MNRCSYCGFDNRDDQTRCQGCGRELRTAASPDRVVVKCQCGQTYYATRRQIGLSLKCVCGQALVVHEEPRPSGPGATLYTRRVAIRAPKGLVKAVLGVAVICGILLTAEFVYECIRLKQFQSRLEDETARARSEREAALKHEQEMRSATFAAEDAAFQKQLSDPAFLSGALAREHYEAEWVRRVAHEPGLASSKMEKMLVHMEQVGRDPQKTAVEALQEVARLAAPPRSRIEVTPSGERFSVRVAFLMSAVSANEAGAVTKHHDTASMRREVQQLSGRVMKALFDYCGTRGVEELSVTCNHAIHRTPIPANATEEERQELLQRAPIVLARLYRVSLSGDAARKVENWRKVPVTKVIGIMNVEIDDLSHLEITGKSLGQSRDPVGELEF